MISDPKPKPWPRQLSFSDRTDSQASLLGFQWGRRRDTLTSEKSFSDDEADEEPYQQHSKFARFLHSWECSVSAWTSLCATILLINLCITIAVAASAGFDDGRGTLMHGDCNTVQSWNTGIHFLINILSTGLLAGSNFCMQCLSAPTRQDLDAAHSRGVALDVGVVSVRNFWYMRKKKFIVWLLFAVSSVPLHLLYNSVTFSSIAYHHYNVVLATPELLSDTSLDVNATIQRTYSEGNIYFSVAQQMQYQDYAVSYTQEEANASREADLYGYNRLVEEFRTLQDQYMAGSFRRLEPRECIQTYSADFMSAYGNVILIPKNTSDQYLGWQMSDLFSPSLDPDVGWLCDSSAAYSGRSCRWTIPRVAADPDALFRPFNDIEIDYCLAQTMVENCKLLFSLPIAMVVLFFNVVKIILMIIAMRYLDEWPLLTIGDCLASFLKRPDIRTRGRCLDGASDFKKNEYPWKVTARKWKSAPARWMRAPGKARWVQLVLPWTFAVITVTALMIFGIVTTFTTALDAFELGLGSARSSTVISAYYLTRRQNLSDSEALVTFCLLANSPQVILSIIYFAYNANLTMMLTGLEWSSLLLKRKGLRVSKNPQKHQRSTYYLQLPYRYSLPLLAASALLHWLLSQALYLVALEENYLDLTGQAQNVDYMYTYSWNYQFNNDTAAAITDVPDYSAGYSPLACLLTSILGVLMLLAILALGYRKYPTGMPLGANNSLVLSAACHPDLDNERDDLAHQKLSWSVVPTMTLVEGAGHCAMSNRHQEHPVPGTEYA